MMADREGTTHLSLILRYITPHRGALAVISGLLIAGSLVALAHPWFAGQLTASLMGDPDHTISTQLLLGLWLALIMVRGLLNFGTQYTIGGAGEDMTCAMRNRLYQHLQALPLGYYQQRRPGETLTLLSSDADIISSFVTDTLAQLLPALLTFGGAFLLMAWLDLTIALLAALCLPLYYLCIKLMARKLRPLSREWIDANSHLNSVVEENLSMLPAIKAFNRETREQKRFSDANSQLLSLSRRQLRIQSALSPAIGLLGGIGLLGLLWVGSGHIENGQLTAPQLVSLILYAVLMMNPLRTLANVYGHVQRARGSAERIIRFLQTQPEPDDDGKLDFSNIDGRIRFENVSFAYPGRPPVIRQLDLDISPGETVALTGPNGSGKTTIAHLLMRFADPDAGHIFIDSLDIRDVQIASVRRQIGLVAQQVLLLNGTIAENIAYGSAGASQEEIEQAAVAARALSFIRKLPEGFNTVIGDQGVRLSGGQRQRISLARTLVGDPPILILDEATAMYDPSGERAFIEECRELLARKTVILITHRPASLALADRVLELQAGTVSKPASSQHAT